MKLLAEDDEGAADKTKLDERKESYLVDCTTISPVDGKDMDKDDNGGDTLGFLVKVRTHDKY